MDMHEAHCGSRFGRLPRLLGLAGVLAAASLTAAPAQAAMYYASSVTSLVRGDTTIGDFTGYYGGTYPGSYPVALTEAQAKAAVVGAPDGSFLSLPGGTPPATGGAWPYEYVEVGFGGMTFDSTAKLVVTELGNSGEGAYVWLWNTSGGFYQESVTRSGANDNLVIDLSGWASAIATHGEITRVGIGGVDTLGASQGFDLDAVGFQVVPEPSTVALFGVGLAALGLFGLRRRQGGGFAI